ncbi:MULTISPECIES: LysR family transcriptional regulator [unclassified Pantoea]|uniref:LysR family transcriptional regulator n=1 Tax=unclassified Pantoea TaxID=2630326 RepID=UPI001CD6FAA2|nr:MULTISPECIES: LysR family transcriptional regulator [unclassified Pantoea]MCA1177865.1 LysR family transcriptional regulator [Pantoea sp. alder69]MCA1251963.1 LysR family transcriptional regulator [Pantoea sp. alder70]MCA1266371.1 LysR family transcriptional regulator [Pantoea sp. alder81]
MKLLLAGKNVQKPLQGWPSVEDLYVFISVARHGGFGRAAVELGQSPSYISKRIAILEKQLDTRLFFRTNRVMRLTPEGEKALEGALQVVQEMDTFLSNFQQWRGELSGDLTVGCSLGFGQAYLSDAISAFISQHPSLNIKLILSDREIDLMQSGTDVDIQVGDNLNHSYIARKLAANRRVLCASSEYLARSGAVNSLDDLINHSCLIINEKNNSFGNWALTDGEQQVLCRLNSHYSSNSGKVILNWALKSHGIALRSAWDVAPYLETGELVHVLPQWFQQANIWAVYTQRTSESPRIKVFIDFLAEYFAEKSLSREWQA